MKKLLLLLPLLLAACGLNAPPASNSTTPVTQTTVQNVQIKATVALSLGELAFTSAEQAATSALRSPSIDKGTKNRIGNAVLIARGYRDQARSAVDKGMDASNQLTALSGAISDIYALTKEKK